ncbi:MAG TPA: glycosyltransferase, partial [Dehalococcoidia bacterium]|nr:glycosyltransferase [Dehalococcoidia bacterium]
MSVYVRQLAKELASRGFYVDIYTRRTDGESPAVVHLADGARVIHLRGGPATALDKTEVYRHLSELAHNLHGFAEAEGLSYHLLHSHYWLSGLVAQRLQLRWGIPHVAMFHTLGEVKNHSRLGEREPSLRIEAERRIVATADRLVAPNYPERSQLVRFYGASAAKIEIIPCGVDLGLFRPLDKSMARRRLGLTARRIILFVGRMDPLKGLDILLQAVARLDDREGLRVLVVGGSLEGDERLSRYYGMAQEMGIAHQVTFLGSLNQDELPLYYNAADL